MFFIDSADRISSSPLLTMGLLTQGRPLTWEETQNHAEFIRKHGIEQFIHVYNKVKDRRNDCLKWGDEVRRTLSTRPFFATLGFCRSSI